MTRGKRILAIVGALGGITVLGWVLLIGAVFAWGGLVTVQVRDAREGHNLYLPVPVALVDVALATSQYAMPLDEMDELLEVHAELGEWGPLVRGVLEALDDCPDVTLVEVEDGDDHVRVMKRGHSLKIEVSDSEFSVRISVPTRAVHRTVSRLLA